MIRYWGGKTRIGKRMAQAIVDLMKHYDLKYDCVVENFCGIGGLTLPLNEILPTNISFVASDADFGVVGFLEAIQNGWTPPKCSITEQEFNKLKETKEDRTPMQIFCGHAGCFNGKYFADRYQDYTNPKLAAGCRKIEKLKHLTQGIEFKVCDYRDYSPKEWNNCLFICDSPYRVIEKYYDCQLAKHFQGFDFVAYETWVREMSKNNYVICCEYTMSDDFACIWSLETLHNNKTNLNKTKIEKLFVWNDPDSLFVQNAQLPNWKEYQAMYPGPYTSLKVSGLKKYTNPCFGMQNVYFDEDFQRTRPMQIKLKVQSKNVKNISDFLKSQGLKVSFK
jgi:hypothetical protein